MFLSGVNMKAVSSYFLPVLANCFCSLMTLLFAFVDATCSEPTKNFSQKIISYPLLSLSLSLSLYLFIHIPTLFFQLLIQWLCLSLPTSVLMSFFFYNHSFIIFYAVLLFSNIFSAMIVSFSCYICTYVFLFLQSIFHNILCCPFVFQYFFCYDCVYLFLHLYLCLSFCTINLS